MPAIGVQGQFAIEGNAFSALDKPASLTHRAEPQLLQPIQADKAETVVQFGDINIRRFQVRPLPHHLRGIP
jgi:hypothetical protein